MLSQENLLNIDDYEKLSKIGQGSMGKVYIYRHKIKDEFLAVKVLKLKELSDSRKYRILIREIKIISKLNYPSLLGFFGYYTKQLSNIIKLYIFTEYMPNSSLDQIIQKERESQSPDLWNDTKKLINIYGIASAMAHLHSKKIVHRDLKPANILEDNDFYPKVADFSLSKDLNSLSIQSSSGPKGTPIYVPPEVWKEEPYVEAGDVYAFSIVVYELVTLKEPFQNLNFFKISQNVPKNIRPSLELPIPKCYKDLISKCWSNNPSERPSFAQIADVLKTDENFLTENVNKEEFYRYVEKIDQANSQISEPVNE